MRDSPKIKEKLHSGNILIGSCISFSDPTISELFGKAGLDFLWIDMEHGPMTIETVQAHVMATQLSEAAPLVRVPWNDLVYIKHVLDVGAAGVIVPMVCTEEDARKAVAACLYPPDGIRGYGPRRPSNFDRSGGPDFINSANRDIVVALQIEHFTAIENLDAILSVHGVDLLLIGPADLSISMGFPLQTRHPSVIGAIETVINKARTKDIPVGIFVGNVSDAFLWIEKGIRCVNIGGDVGYLVNAIDGVVEKLREGLQK